MKNIMSLDTIFQNFRSLGSSQLILENGLILCNYQRFHKNFYILQKQKNFQRFKKNNQLKTLRQPSPKVSAAKVCPLASIDEPTKVHWFLSNKDLCQNKNIFTKFIKIRKRIQNPSLRAALVADRPLAWSAAERPSASLPLPTKCSPSVSPQSLLQDKSLKVSPAKLFLKNIWFQHFEKSNQNTYFLQRPLSFPFQWIQKGDLLSDCSGSHNGELALGQNLFVAYMPWEGFNFEDAVLINKKILLKYTSLHIQKYEIEIKEFENNSEQITSQIPGLPKKDIQKLDKNGIIKIGSRVQENDILVGKILSTPPTQISPLLTHEKLLYDLLGSPSKKVSPIQEKCLRVPLGSFGRILRITYTHENQLIKDVQKKQKDNQSVLKSIYRPGLRLRRSQQTSFLWIRLSFIKFKLAKCRVNFFSGKSCFINLSKNLIQFLTRLKTKSIILMKHQTIFSRWFWFYKIFARKLKKIKLSTNIIQGSNSSFSIRFKTRLDTKQNFVKNHILKTANLQKVTIYIAEQREFQIGDKISGRHGNKGIISKICSNLDMPYCMNGRTLDILLNPLGVPSRMNVGQIFECLLGFTGQIFQTKFQVICFDEIYGYEASRSFIYSKLLESCIKTSGQWLFSKKTPGKCHLFDGQTGQNFHQPVTIGSSYLMKLIHIVDEKIHARATGPYSLITQQPLRGRAQHGGQRVGEMEVWALQGFGSAYILQELLTVKSDDLLGRNQLMHTLLKNTPFRFGTPESFRVVLRELQCLCLDLQLK